jgi:penicillin-insensitive murein endopeptidase
MDRTRILAVIAAPLLPIAVAVAQSQETKTETSASPQPAAVVPAPVPAQRPATASPAQPAVVTKTTAPANAPDTATASPQPAAQTQTKSAAKDAAPQPTEKPKPTPAKELFGAAKTPAPLFARAIGSYAKGCLAGAQALAIDGSAWQAMRLSRNRNWGHPKLIALLERFATEMKTKEKWPGLLIGDIAQPRGGPMLTGHKSHQLGLDADIWFKPMPDRTLSREERETFEPLLLAADKGTEVIAANWNEGFVRLVKRAASYPEVARIFVHPAIKKAFCGAAGGDRAWLHKVRPMWLHNYHFHVRIGCPKGSTTCEAQPPIPEGDGCGKELEDWIKRVSAPPKPAPPKPSKPAPPKPELTLDQLPKECRAVLAAGEPKSTPPATPAEPTKAAQQR